ncbi:MAG: mechanosensitive ion channel family protein [Acidimicrobiales bacterium]
MNFAVTIRAQDVDVEQISSAINGDGLGPWDYAQAVIIFAAALVLSRLVKLAVKRLVSRGRADAFLGDLLGRVTGYVIITFGLVYALESLGIAVGPVLGALGIIGIAVAFALQDILENFVAGIILQVRRPFGPDDEIVADGQEGRVLAIDARTVTVRTPDGETVRIPSASVIKNPITNHTQLGRRRTTVAVGVAYGTDLRHATEVTRSAVVGCSGVLDTPRVEVYVEGFGSSSIDLAVRYWHQPSIAELWRVRHNVNVAIAEAYEEAGIEIPFPQRVLHFPPDSANIDDQQR